MSDSEEKRASDAAVPSWQMAADSNTTAGENTPADNGETLQPNDKLEVARQFLEDGNVKDAPREKKVEFLKGKGIEDLDIQKLLGKEEEPTPSKHEQSTTNEAAQTQRQQQPQQSSGSPPPPPPPPPPASSPATDRPPIVTYPEFLTKPERPPPLVTTTSLLNTLYAVTGLSTLLYGTSKYVVAPMVASQTEARYDLHDTTSNRLNALVTKLESCVSEVPAPKRPNHADDALSEAEDPAEMFHRDMGTQTSSPFPSGKQDLEEAPVKRQVKGLAKLNKSLAELRDELRSESDGLETVKTTIDVLRDDLDTLTYGGKNGYMSGYDIYGRAKKAEPEDEIRKARDNIRRVKGVLLSTRNFPASTR